MINRKNRTTMKLRKYLAVLAVAAFASLATSCAEAEDEFIHTDSTINSIPPKAEPVSQESSTKRRARFSSPFPNNFVKNTT